MKDETYITPKEDLMNEALKHYEEAANAIHHWNNSIPKAIRAYYTEPIEPLPAPVTDEMIEKAINNMIESKLHVRGFKEWMIEKNYDHNDSYTEFYIDQDNGYRAFTIDELFKHYRPAPAKKMSYSQIRELKAMSVNNPSDCTHYDCCQGRNHCLSKEVKSDKCIGVNCGCFKMF